MKKIVVFASGSGSNAENIIQYFNSNGKAEVVAVYTNNPNAGVIERVKKYGLEAQVFTKTALYESDFLQNLNKFNADLIVLAGFLWKFPEAIIADYPNKVINIHPALLPKYGGKGMYGMHVHRAVVENKEQETGITIHYVNENYDEGAIIFQKSFELAGIETPEEVAAKIHELEYQHFPEVIEDLLFSKN
ncbi:phosphoribosylglycinamide formyltransferase [Flavobacterium sp. UMI-01]|uniref:phosphoribosylglycinamide formyltransferase n=1 Tax=Flavobacterium sp. UMI-01 TaxID=1441053 RepID=UPI001C7D9F92|nr:phosphoribosylglycinamide formyltransferase [Flavobacterium sp. UMI-01]GIZ07958.1 phosphoribosylglycinamide formyltransferase [Flavobacterium sp. UMI-01]